MIPILFAIFLLCASSNTHGQDTTGNILINGGFEQSKNGIMPENWNGDNNIYSLSKETIYGKYSLRYVNSDPSVYKICTQMLKINPGRIYSAGVKIKTSDISGSDYGASFCIEWLDENGKWFGGAYPKGIKGTNGWIEINSVISIPDSAKKVLFCCYVRKGMTGTAWFDDAYIRPYMYNKLRVTMLKPVYRGMLINGQDQKIVLSVNTENIAEKNDSSFISTTLADSLGKELIKEVTKLTVSKSNYIISLNPQNTPEGSYTLSMALFKKDNASIVTWRTKIKVITKENQPEVYFDNYKRLIINDKPTFPLGMYWSYINEDDLKIYTDSKFNFILPYNPPKDDQMKLAQKYGMKVIYSVKDYYSGTQFVPAEIKSPADEMPLLKKTIDQYKDNPALLAWYNNDELTAEFMDRLNEHYNTISNSDPQHPVLSIIVDPSQAALYLNSTDVIGSDPYVVPNLPLFNVGKATQTINQNLQDSRPVWMVIQAHNIGNYKEFVPNPQDYRTPTYDEMRSMSWQAICEGANGLIYYSYFDLKRNPDVPFAIQWSNLKKIVSEIDGVSDVLLSDEKTDTIQVVGADGDPSWFNWTVRKYKNRMYIFVVNNGSKTGGIKIKIPKNFKSVNLINGTLKNIFIKDSEFNDTLQVFDVKIYMAY